MTELPKAYNPSDYERDIYATWESSGFFSPDVSKGKKRFSMTLPPANVTGILHIGHAVMLGIQDILARFHRMRGEKTLWLPGTDHAAIATQNVVEKQLKAEGKTKHDLGREKFLKRIEIFIATSRGTIQKQMRSMGASLDWSRERYTMDAQSTAAVHEAFIRMYTDGLIYRGNRVVQWCPRCESTLADDEVKHTETRDTMHFFYYDHSFKKDFGHPIATTRPETKFGDTAIAVDPNDLKYKKLVGKKFNVTFDGIKRELIVVGDEAVKVTTGSGALGVTPSHSQVDEEIASRHKLPAITVIDKDAKMTSEAGKKYIGLSVDEARKRIVDFLQKNGLMEKEEDIIHCVPTCYRCGTHVEALPLKQWFIAVDKSARGNKSLKQLAIEAVRSDKIALIPQRFEKTFFHWMDNLHDWNISRQLWFGHRIPVWYKDDVVKAQTISPGKGWTQDPDVLDTWFSSGLWTFSTLGWPDKTKDLKAFHPTDVMETSYDIIFFWVARMIMLSTYLVGEIPFKSVYFHGLVRDAQGRKMSKSLGNGIDPMAMAEKYGADATRLSLIIGRSPGLDFRLSEQKIAAFRNFVNKLWNVGRFTLMQEGILNAPITPKPTSPTDTWILHRTNAMITSTTEHIETFRFSEAGQELYDFIWHEFADWYLEITKVEPNPSVLKYCLTTILKLCHPFMPFVTERIWKELSDDMLIIQSWPKPKKVHENAVSIKKFQELQSQIVFLRRLRSIYHIPPKQKFALDLPSPGNQKVIENLGHVYIAKIKHGLTFKTPTSVCRVDLGDSFDPDKEVVRLKKEYQHLVATSDRLKQQLSNDQFVQNAPQEVVASERNRLADITQQIDLVNQAIRAIS